MNALGKTLFVLGAGASRQAGAPLMADFLDVAEDLFVGQKVGNAKDDFQFVFDGLHLLRQAQIKGAIDLDNVEAVFAAFEMAKLLRPFPNYFDYERLLSALRNVIAKTLESSVRFPVGPQGLVLPPKPYDEFAELLSDIGPMPPSVITFNYDIGLDYACLSKGIGIDYGLNRSPSGCMEVLKLHGSLNWNSCEKCHHVEPNTNVPQYPIRHHDGNEFVYYPVSPNLAGVVCPKCNESAHTPMLVPPTWSKTQHYSAIQPVWLRAAEQISRAENMFVIGYSLPPTDEFFRYLFALGSIGATRIKRFWVFNPDSGVASRYESLLGPEARKRFELFTDTFDKAIEALRDKLRIERSRARGA